MNLITPNLPFRCAKEYITYLGIKIPSDLSKTYPLSFPPLLASLCLDLQKLEKGKLLWMGRSNAVKMAAFPRLLYLFQTLPIRIPSRFLKDTNKMFAEFIWSHK